MLKNGQKRLKSSKNSQYFELSYTSKSRLSAFRGKFVLILFV